MQVAATHHSFCCSNRTRSFLASGTCSMCPDAPCSTGQTNNTQLNKQQPGCTNCADCISRDPLYACHNSSDTQESVACLHYITCGTSNQRLCHHLLSNYCQLLQQHADLGGVMECAEVGRQAAQNNEHLEYSRPAADEN